MRQPLYNNLNYKSLMFFRVNNFIEITTDFYIGNNVIFVPIVMGGVQSGSRMNVPIYCTLGLHYNRPVTT